MAVYSQQESWLVLVFNISVQNCPSRCLSYFLYKGCLCTGYINFLLLFLEIKTLTLCVLMRDLKEHQTPNESSLPRILTELKKPHVCSF